MMILSRATSDNDIDSIQLKNALNLILNDLEVPFLERRAKSKQHKKTPMEELSAVIQEITNRERELQAAVGIAKMLLDRNDDLNAKRKKLFNKKHLYKSIIQHKDKEIESLKEQIISLENKYQMVKETIVKAEEENLKLLAENKRIQYESAMKKEIVITDSSQNYEIEIYELKAQFNEQYEYLKKTKTDLEREIKSKDEIIKGLEKDVTQITDNSDRIKRDSAKQHKKVKELEEYLKELESQKSILEDKCRDLNVSSLKMRAQNEKLIEDLKMYQLPAAPKKQKIRRQISLMDELGIIEEPHFEAKHSYTLSRCPPSKAFQLSSTDNLNILAIKKEVPKVQQIQQQRRKDPSEEYFTLITQAVKLNSPYMDAICVIPPNELYQKALKEDIPYHKWHLWVESQLNSAYIQLVYKSDMKSR